MIRDMTLRGFSPRTHEAYIGAVVGLAKYSRRSPDQISNDEVQAYLARWITGRPPSHRLPLMGSLPEASEIFDSLLVGGTGLEPVTSAV